MALPGPDEICAVCKPIMTNLLTTDLPYEDEPGIPHHKTLASLEASTATCALCCQFWIALGYSLGNRGGMVTFQRRRPTDSPEISIKSLGSNFGMGGLFRGMANGAVVSNVAGEITPELEEKLNWVHPRSLMGENEEVGSYIFGNWWKSPFQGQEDRLMLVGLGVRLGTSPSIGDAVGNKPDEWFLAGTYLRVRTMFDSSVAHFIPGRIRNWDLSSERAISQVKAWLNICDKYHQCLEQSSDGNIDPVLPTRVLSMDASSGKVHLLETQGKRARYIALSHSWGKSHRLTLSKSNLATLKEGIELAEIPQTFKDAIIICRALDVQYLWIDSLCIVQDDAADWEREASKMSSVYRNSYLTISALHSADDAEGCFPTLTRGAKQMPFPFVSPDVTCTGRPAIPNAVPFIIPKDPSSSNADGYNYAVVFSMHGEGDKQYYITNEWMPSSTESSPKIYATFNFGASFDPLKTEPLSSRGWVLQERLLSLRTLHYSEGQMYWECQNVVLGEDGSMLERKFPRMQTIVESRQKALQLGTAVEDVPTQYVQDEWLKLIEVFCTRKLTMDYDKLVAISGLASIVGEKSGDVYYAGLWKSNFVNGLCWKKKVFVPHHQCSDESHEHALPHPTAANIVAPSQYRAPSWSWAAIDGEIGFENIFLDSPSQQRNKMIAELVEVSVTPLGAYKFGRVKSGFVKLKTFVGELRLADAPAAKQAGQLLDEFSVFATLFPTTGEKAEKKEPKRLSNLFSGLKLSSNSSSPVPAKVWFDIEQNFPCTAAFITNRCMLVLKPGSDGKYTRIGLAELGEKDAEEFMKGSSRKELVIL